MDVNGIDNFDKKIKASSECLCGAVANYCQNEIIWNSGNTSHRDCTHVTMQIHSQSKEAQQQNWEESLQPAPTFFSNFEHSVLITPFSLIHHSTSLTCRRKNANIKADSWWLYLGLKVMTLCEHGLLNIVVIWKEQW